MDIPSAPPADPFARLNPEQRAAVLHGDAPLLVIAGAGTGKTDTLVHRLARLVRDGADPRRILLMTFSRRAAADMTRRAQRIAAEALGPRSALLDAGLAWAGTFHAIGARLLREHAAAIGLDPAFTIQDREDSADLMALARHRLGLGASDRRFPTKGTCLAIYSRTVNARADLGPVLGRHFPWCAEWEGALRSLFAAYVAAKQESAVLDYDDLLLIWAAMMEEAEIASAIGSRFDHVLVDEYQDTNRLQAEILLALKPDGHGVTVVGDDAQSIYAFRAAEVRNILDFPGHFTPRAATVALEQNYRSTPEILAAANAVIAEAGEGYLKSLRSDRPAGPRPAIVAVRDESGQVEYVCRQILDAREAGTALRKQAVLFRTASHSGPLEVELVRRNIPFVKFGGLKFLDSAHVKDMLACLRFAQNRADRISGFRVLQLLPGVGPASAEAILGGGAAPRRVAAEFTAFASLLDGLRSRPDWPGELAAIRAWYVPHLERLYEDAAVRAADLLQLEAIAATFPDRERFLTEITLDPPGASSDHAGVPSRDEDYLILSTIHSAKGQEWRNVFVLNCVDGCIPSDLGTGTSAEIDEERRLLYVAMTRARDALHLVAPQRFYVHGQHRNGDRHVYATRSRFIPPSILDRFERTIWPVVPIAGPVAAAPSPPAVDLAARMRAMWQ